ncbi:sensor histidine kinase [Yinghuangia seranimata]|uniref:sensor histidine kinase n=1 Tax=Yinghuangia seranimata TaxID=408067 RepID=UPI00248B7488|nr:sensor histidine kinase [Yinghuangia seranimata]MDI2132345.1 sensor histidine kinase [Yinghuangia seranimata]
MTAIDTSAGPAEPAPPGRFGPRFGRPFAWLARDVAVSALVLVLQTVGTIGAAHGQRNDTDLRGLDALALVLVCVGPLLLLARRRHPVAVLVLSLLPPLAYTLRDYPPGPIYLSLIVALFTAMTAGHRAVSYVMLVVGYFTLGWLGPWVRDNSLPDAAWAGGVAAWLLVLATFSEVVRVRRQYAAAERMRAAEEQRRVTEEQAARVEAERRRAGEERLRIARELHDVLAHHISLMNVQASVGLELMDANPEQARSALTAVKQASREALGELRGVLAVLKGGDDAEAAPRTPTYGIADLDDLAARASTAHLAVRLERADAVSDLTGPVGLAAYRIVQEAVTNAVRHSGASVVTVRLALTDGDEALRVAVEDDGRGPDADPAPQAGGGHGLRNMRERATALGGTLSTGARAGGGFAVVAVLPLSRDDAPAPAPNTGTGTSNGRSDTAG